MAVFQIRDFQLVGQWAEGLKGISRSHLVQESCIFLLPRSTKNGEDQCWFILYHIYNKALSWETIVINWIDIMNVIFKKLITRRSYPNIHYILIMLVISRNLHLFWPTKTPKLSAMTDDRPLFATLHGKEWNPLFC